RFSRASSQKESKTQLRIDSPQKARNLTRQQPQPFFTEAKTVFRQRPRQCSAAVVRQCLERLQVFLRIGERHVALDRNNADHPTSASHGRVHHALRTAGNVSEQSRRSPVSKRRILLIPQNNLSPLLNDLAKEPVGIHRVLVQRHNSPLS